MGCSEKKLFKDDAGITFRVWSGPDVSLADALTLTLKVLKPSGTEVSWTASLAGDNNYYAVYTSASDDLDQEGEYRISLVVTFSGGVTFTGKTDTFEVFSRFYDLP